MPYLFLQLMSAVAIYFSAAWWLKGLICIPAALFGCGWGWAKWLRKDEDSALLQMSIDSFWMGMTITWIAVALLREFGLGTSEHRMWILWAFTGLIGGVGTVLSWQNRPPLYLPIREKIGLGALTIGILFLIIWKQADIQRPLDGYWYLDGATSETNVYVPLEPSRHWASRERIGWEDAGAWKLIPDGKNPDLVARDRVNGRVTIAVRGPLGSYIEAGGQRAEVAKNMVEFPEEGPVRRYLDKGVAAISIWVDLQPGEFFGLDVEGEEVYLMSSAEAVWALHATGTLRYFIYYQLLNQVENQVWAQEILEDRRFTWNQPPGWSPLLAMATVFTIPDLPGAAILFLWVLVLVGLSTLRLASVAAPSAPMLSWAIPAALVVVHGLLMFEPGSINFPDSLYAAALVGVMTSVIKHDLKGFGFLGVWAQALRWPGGFLSVLMFFLARRTSQLPVRQYLRNLSVGIGLGMVIAGIAMASGDAEDLLFILYFETFPEHWHGNYNPIDLLSRLPNFYAHWTMYTGGGLLLAIPFLIGHANRLRNNLRVILGTALIYSLILGTIDHNPSHYFLPLVALTGPAVICAIGSLPNRNIQMGLSVLQLLGIGVYLWFGIV
ncbi:MAG: hypothetical protein ACON4U_13260 [Myxococcota bacterium]